MKPKYALTITVFICINTLAQSNFVPIKKRSPIANSRFEHLLNAKKWNFLFPNRHKIYSYEAIKEATSYFPEFLNSPDNDTQRRELAAFLATIAQETSGGWDKAPGGYFKWGLYFLEEQNPPSAYIDSTKPLYPAPDNRSYHGRGPTQLSWNYNYGQFSEAWFGQKDSLLSTPSAISTNPLLCFASALWFWCTPQSPKPSCHQIISHLWTPTALDIQQGRLPGFGSIVNVINGGIECGMGKNQLKTQKRYAYYIYFCKYFKVSPGENISCKNQLPFSVPN